MKVTVENGRVTIDITPQQIPDHDLEGDSEIIGSQYETIKDLQGQLSLARLEVTRLLTENRRYNETIKAWSVDKPVAELRAKVTQEEMRNHVILLEKCTLMDEIERLKKKWCKKVLGRSCDCPEANGAHLHSNDGKVAKYLTSTKKK